MFLVVLSQDITMIRLNKKNILLNKKKIWMPPDLSLQYTCQYLYYPVY